MYKPKKMSLIALALIVLSVAMVSLASAQYDWDYYDDGYSDDAAGLAFLGLGLACIFPLIWLIIAILIAIWVYKDAEKRGSSGALWLIIVIFTGIIGLIIWLVIRPPIGGKPEAGGGAEPDRRCPNCGRGIPNDARVCPYCNKNFEQ